MSNLYKIDNKNEIAYFRASMNQLRRILEGDRYWANSMMIDSPSATKYPALKVRIYSYICPCKIEETGHNYFIARGTRYFCFKVEAVSENVSQITPLGKLSFGRNVWIPCQLLVPFILPIIFAPLVYGWWIWETKQYSGHVIEPFCNYLEFRGQQIYRQKGTAEIRR